MKAQCADGSSAGNRLFVSPVENKLKWSGQRGTQIYTKCA